MESMLTMRAQRPGQTKAGSKRGMPSALGRYGSGFFHNGKRYFETEERCEELRELSLSSRAPFPSLHTPDGLHALPGRHFSDVWGLGSCV